MSVNDGARSRGIKKDIFPIFFNVNKCCVFSLESPHRGDSNENIQHTIINIKKKITQKIISNTIMSIAVGYFC